VKQRVRRLSEQAGKIGHESTRMRLDEVPLKRGIIYPLLEKDVTIFLLEVGIDTVTVAPRLRARLTAHLGGDLEEALAMLGRDLDSAGDDYHGGHAIGAGIVDHALGCGEDDRSGSRLDAVGLDGAA
jgi:hypothetical protein